MNQIELQKEIDKTITLGRDRVNKKTLNNLLNNHKGGKEYFFSKSTSDWLDWLWKNGFLDDIKKKSEDPSSYNFSMPELNYLVRIAKDDPEKVTEIMCSFKISSKNFNPEVIDQFTRIANDLPPNCLKRVVKKMRDEKWVTLMGKYTQYGYDYGKMFATLSTAKEYEGILHLSEALLAVKKQDFDKKDKPYRRKESDFYIIDIAETKVFHSLVNLPAEYQNKALKILTNAYANIIKKTSEYTLLDEDFFTISVSNVEEDSYKEELKLLIASVLDITKKLFNNEKTDKRKLYLTYFSELPKNTVTYRLKLAVWGLAPKTFIKDLENVYFSLFKVKDVSQLLYGTEYVLALKAGFTFLSKGRQQNYINKVLDLFGNLGDTKNKSRNEFYGSKIFSTLHDYLSSNQNKLAREKGFTVRKDYKPETAIGRVVSGSVTNKSPMDLSQLKLNEIIDKLSKELSPKQLELTYKNQDHFERINAEGVASNIREDIKKRLLDYLNAAELFFDRDKISPQYTNAYLRGIKDALEETRNSKIKDRDYENLINLLTSIVKSGEKKSFVEEDSKTADKWISNWNSVHATMSDLVQELIREKNNITLINFKKYRDEIFTIISYLLKNKDPVIEDEKLNTAKSKIKRPNESEYYISDPFTIAINSVRGRAFQTLQHFVYQETKNNNQKKLAKDVKITYKELLENEDTRAIMFLFGHYLYMFYFSDTEWVSSKILKSIFESSDKDKYLKLASLEGYLSNNLYYEMFFDPYMQKLYSNNIEGNLVYPKQKFYKNPYISIATHCALAFIHYKEFDFKHPLFKRFIDKASEDQLREFIRAIGKNMDKIGQEDWRIDKAKKLWELFLGKKSDSKALEEFGFWIEQGVNILEVNWTATQLTKTLAATKGKITWDYGLLKSIEKIANKAPIESLHILESLFMGKIEDKKNFFSIREEKEWYSAFKILYNSKDEVICDKTYDLINSLMEKGGSKFWALGDIVKQTK